MQYVRLGHTGLRVSRLCLGTMTYGSRQWRAWVLDEEESKPFYRKAFDVGINFFDTADMYSLGMSEEVLGRAVREHARRDDVVLATKVYNPMSDDVNDRGLSRKHILSAIDHSLRRLGTDYVDLYQIHRFDPHTPVEETMEALHDVVRSGKARYLGASSMYAWQFAAMQHTAERHGWTKFVSMQNHYNLVYREEEREVNPFCLATGIGIIPWSPMARGFLAGNRNRQGSGETPRAQGDDYARSLYFRDEDFAVADRNFELARRRGVSPSQTALAWLLHKPGVTAPIIGASKLQHFDEAVAALEIPLHDDEIRFLEEPYRPHPIIGHN
jgi:aryl-alcohol dehydrogenase (NADP+)